MVTVTKQRVVPPGVFSSDTGFCERGTEMQNPLVKPVSNGAGEEPPHSTLGARSVSAIRDVEHKNCLRSDSALVGNRCGRGEGKKL